MVISWEFHSFIKIFIEQKVFKIFGGFFSKTKGFLPEVHKIFWESMKYPCVSCFLGADV